VHKRCRESRPNLATRPSSHPHGLAFPKRYQDAPMYPHLSWNNQVVIGMHKFIFPRSPVFTPFVTPPPGDRRISRRGSGYPPLSAFPLPSIADGMCRKPPEPPPQCLEKGLSLRHCRPAPSGNAGYKKAIHQDLFPPRSGPDLDAEMGVSPYRRDQEENSR